MLRVAALPTAAAATAGACWALDRRSGASAASPAFAAAGAPLGGPAAVATSSKTTSTDCVSSTALLVLRGVGAGFAWTLGVDAYALLGASESEWRERLAARQTTKAREVGRSLALLGARNMLGFAAFLGIFGGVSCSLEKLRGRTDLLNPFVGGFTAGLAILPGELRSPRLVLTTALLCGAASMGFHFFIPSSGEGKSESDGQRARR